MHDRVEDPERGGADGLAALSAEARTARAWACWSTSCPTTSGSRRPGRQRWWWDVLEHGPGVALRGVLRHRLGVRATAGCWCRSLGRRRRGRRSRWTPTRRRAALPRPPASRSLPAPTHACERAALRAGQLAARRRRAQLPALLHGDHPGRRPRRGAGGVRADARRDRAGSTRASSTGCGSTTPTACATRRATSTDLAALTGGAYVAGREDPRARRGAAARVGDAPAPPGTTCSALIDRVLTDPAGERRRLEPSCAGHGRLRRAGPRHASARSPTAVLQAEVRRIVRELPDLLPHAVRGRCEDAVAELLACFPVYRSYLPARSRAPRRGARAAPARSGPTSPAALDDAGAGAGRPGPAGRAAVPADQRDGDGQGRRGLRVLPVLRGSPRSTRSAATRRSSRCRVDEFHEAMATPAARAGRDAMTTLSTHDTKRSEDVRARIAVLAEVPDAVGADARAAARSSRRCRTRLRQPALAGRASAPGRSSRERLHAYAEKAMREAGDRTTWTDPDEDVRGRRARRGRRGLRRRGGRARSSRSWSPIVGRPAGATRSPRSCCAHRARRARRLPGQRARGPQPGRPGQPAAGGLRRRPTASARRRRPTPSRRSPREALRLRRDRPELFTSYTPLRAEGPAADHVLAFDRGGAVTVVTRLPLGLAAKGGWGETTLALPGAGPPPGRPTCSAATPPPCWSWTAAGELVHSAAAFDVWAPRPARGSGCRWATTSSRWTAAPTTGGRRRSPCRTREEVDYGYLVDDSDTPLTRPAVAAPAGGRTRALANLRPRRASRGPTSAGPGGSWPASVDLRAARRHVHAGGHLRRRARAARPPAWTSASTSSS